MKSNLRIAIVGSGLGGLCLAQNLRRRGIHADVFERDASPWDRPQGYRLHLDADGTNALYDSLPPALFRVFDATAMKPQPFTTICDTALNVRARRSHDQHGGTSAQARGGVPAHVNVNRATLREILLADLPVSFGKKLVSFDESAGGVVLTFADGSHVESDLLVGADGIHSIVRARRAPNARLQDTGVRAIYGRIPFATARACLSEQACGDVFTVAVDDRKCFLGLGPVEFPVRPEHALATLHPQDDYVVCIVGGRAELFPTDALTLTAPQLQLAAVDALRQWPSATRDVVARGDRDSFFFVEMNTSVPTHLPAPVRSTLLGDAIHAMTPTVGRGANLAMRDAALLARHIAETDSDLSLALARYESEMLAYGFDVVRTSAAMGEQLMGQRPLPSES